MFSILVHIIRGHALLSEATHQLVGTPIHTSGELCQEAEIFTTASVLVVDDNQDTRNGLVRMIKKYASVTAECENGVTGLAAYKNSKEEVKAVFVDYQMPEMNGVEMAESIRIYETEHQLPKTLIICNYSY